jgi:hypothetical protein
MLFVYIRVKDFVSDELAVIADALMNPIAYQSELERLERREKQLSKLEDTDFDSTSPVVEETILPYFNRVLETSVVHQRSGSLTPLQQTRVNDPSVTMGCDPTSGSNVNRSTSVPGSPYQSTGDISRIGLSLSTRLVDACVVEVMRLSDLKGSKSYVKLIAKQTKQLEALRRKHQKAQGAKMLSQQSEIDKLLQSLRNTWLGGGSSTAAGKLPMITSSSKQFKSYVDRVAIASEVAPWFDDGCNEMIAAVRRRHVEELITLCCEHYRIEHELQLCHQSSISVLLERLAAAQRDEQCMRLDKMHTCEVNELKRRQDARNWDEMKEMAKKYRDKNELARVRREAMQKHVKLAVQERQNLKDLLESRRAEVVAGYSRLLQQIAINRKREEDCLQKFFETQCSAIAATHRATVLNSSGTGFTDRWNSNNSSSSASQLNSTPVSLLTTATMALSVAAPYTTSSASSSSSSPPASPTTPSHHCIPSPFPASESSTQIFVRLGHQSSFISVPPSPERPASYTCPSFSSSDSGTPTDLLTSSPASKAQFRRSESSFVDVESTWL